MYSSTLESREANTLLACAIYHNTPFAYANNRLQRRGGGVFPASTATATGKALKDRNAITSDPELARQVTVQHHMIESLQRENDHLKHGSGTAGADEVQVRQLQQQMSPNSFFLNPKP